MYFTYSSFLALLQDTWPCGGFVFIGVVTTLTDVAALQWYPLFSVLIAMTTIAVRGHKIIALHGCEAILLLVAAGSSCFGGTFVGSSEKWLELPNITVDTMNTAKG